MWQDAPTSVPPWEGTVASEVQWAGEKPDEKPKKKRKIFVWFFLAVQLLFIIWVIAGAMTANGSQGDCGGNLAADTCNSAHDAGTAIGVILVIVFWCIVDFLLAVGYAVYRLAKRP